jgi:hypothetical protein
MRDARLASTWGFFLIFIIGIFSLSFSTSNVEAQTCSPAPCVTGTRPTNGEINVCRNEGVAADILVPALTGNGVDPSTLSTSTVFLKDPDGVTVPATYNTTGGNDAFIMSPNVDLAANKVYTYTVTSGLKDLYGNAFAPYSMSFTTGLSNCGGDTPVRFTKTDLTSVGNGTNGKYTSVVIGPDNRLYAGMITGRIRIFDINANGTITLDETLEFFYNANFEEQRPVIGMTFDPASTPDNIILWVSNNNSLAPGKAHHFSGAIDKLVGININQNNESWTRNQRIIGLPRSRKDHLVNGLAFGPDGALYAMVGSVSAMGAPDGAWGLQPETLLAGAVLRIDTAQLEQLADLPLNVATGTANSSDPQQLSTNYGFGEIPPTLYDPQKANAPLKIYASGIRNAYDLLWHTNGRLYAPTNGSAAGGNTPGFPAQRPVACDLRIDGSYTGPQNIPAASSVETQKDYLFRVLPNKYYGHPNPKRCEWVMNGGNPTSGADPAEVLKYPVGVNPDPNWGGSAFDFGYNRSPNGVIEYKTNIYNGAMRGWILVVRYSKGDDIIALKPSSNGASITNQFLLQNTSGIVPFSQPLDLVEDTRNGNIYVAEYQSEDDYTEGKISLLKPNNTNAAPIAVNDLYTVTQGQVLNVDAANGVLANDSDLNGDPMTAVLQLPTGNGSLTLNANGSFIYTPNGGFSGTDFFTYLARDNKGADDNIPANVTINVLPTGVTPTNTPTDEPATDTPTPFPTDTPDPLTPTVTPSNTPDPLTPTVTPTATSTDVVNLVFNGSFEDKVEDGSPELLPWTAVNATGDKIKCNKPATDDKPAKIYSYEGGCAFRFKGGVGENSRIQQVLPVDNLFADDALNLALYVSGSSVPLEAANAQLKIKYGDGSKDKAKIVFTEGDFAYTPFSSVVILSDAPAKLKLQIRYQGTSGKVLVDSVVVLVNIVPTGAGTSGRSTGAGATDVLPLPLPGAGN